MQKDEFFRLVRLLRKKSSGANRGFSLIEALAAIAVLAVGSGVYLSSSNMKTHDQLRVQQSATQMKTISAAAAQYARTNASTLLSLTTPGSATGYPVSLSALEAAGYLPTGYLATNPWGQTVGVEYYQPVAGTLATIVYTSGGTSIDGRNLVMAAKLQGSQGGYVPTSELQTTYAGQGICSGSCVQGAGNAWQFPMSVLSVPSTAGHLVTYSSLNNQSLVHDTLYRSAVPGNPNANTMQTNINMNGNNINNLNDLLNVNDIQTYNLTSPNGTVNMDGNSLSSGSINTNGQPITNVGSLSLSSSQISYYNPCGISVGGVNSCTSTLGLGSHLYCALAGDVGGGASGPVMLVPYGGNPPSWVLYSWNNFGDVSGPMAVCLE